MRAVNRMCICFWLMQAINKVSPVSNCTISPRIQREYGVGCVWVWVPKLSVWVFPLFSGAQAVWRPVEESQLCLREFPVSPSAFVRLRKPQIMFMTDLYAINAKENNHYMCVCLPARPMWVQNVAIRIHKDGINACVCCGWNREGVQIVFHWHGQHLDICEVPRFKLKNPKWMSSQTFPNVSLSCWRLTCNNPDCDLWWDANICEWYGEF